MNNLFSRKQSALKTGKLGEKIAAEYLERNNYRVLEKNFKNSFGRRVGEIDIVALKENELIFVEVKAKTKKDGYNILPEEQITANKIRKLEKIAQIYIKNHSFWHLLYHFDAISILFDEQTKTASIRHLENIFHRH